jgi:cell division protein FtsI (penicillin-binding protein 3)
MRMAIQKSSNIYVARIIQRVVETMGDNWYRDALQNVFGFGVKTGIELPSESLGMVPMPGKKYPNGRMEWSKPTPFSIAFGHNILANSLQVVRAYGILANGGHSVQPHLIRKIVRTGKDNVSEILLDNTQNEQRQSTQLLEPEIVQEVVNAMKYTTKPGGSATKGDIWGYTEVGKTATSEKIVNGVYSKKDHISTFVGFAPLNQPRFVLLIAIDDPEYKYIPGVGKNQMGGTCAAPAFREIGSRVLEYLGVEPDDPYGLAPGDPRRNAEKAYWMNEVKMLKELYTQWNR